MAQGKFKKQLSLVDITLVGLGAIFGSGWLFGASHVASIAGPGGIYSWIIGGVAVMLLGFVFCELGAALPKAGGILRFPVCSHGEMMGYLLGCVTVIAFSSLIAIEVVAARQYATAWLPGLSAADCATPTILGWLFQFGLTAFFFLLNYRSIKTFAVFNNVVSVFKFVVPFLVIVVLLRHFDMANMTCAGFAPFGTFGVQHAVSAGGIIFAYLGLTPVVAIASEAKNPQKTLPFALILSIVLSTIIYILLQLAFLGSIPATMLTHGWGPIKDMFTLPYHDIALIHGIGWLALLTVADAIISPSGCGNIYMTATPRVIFAWSRSGTFFRKFTEVDAKSGIPRPALWLTFALAVFWTMPFPSWEKLINVVSAALVLSYALAPVTCGALRKNAPDLPRPFRVRCIGLVGPLAFIVAALIVYWSGWDTVSWLLGVQLLLFVLYIIFRKYVPTENVSFRQQVKSSLWLIGFYVFTMILSSISPFGGSGVLKSPWDTLIVAAMALAVYYWGVNTGLPKANITEAPDED